MITVAGKVLSRELPVARHDPFMDAADDLDTALATVEKRIEIPGHLTKILAQRRHERIGGGEPETFVVGDLRDRNQAPLFAVQFAMIGFSEVWHPGQAAVIGICPAVIGTDEARGVAIPGAAETVAPMAADIQERTHGSCTVTQNQHRVFTHGGGEKSPRSWDLTVMTQKQPATCEDGLQFLLVNIRIVKDTPADQAAIGIDEFTRVGDHVLSPLSRFSASQAKAVYSLFDRMIGAITL
jgi:hypothetical protein